MKELIIALTLGAATIVVPLSSSLAASVPCEEMLKDLRAAQASTTLAAPDQAKVTELATKGIERCNADDDKRADEFFAAALKILGK
jgi:hypothetical protein